MPRFGWSGNLYLYFCLFELADPFPLHLPFFHCLIKFDSSLLFLNKEVSCLGKLLL